MIQTIKSLFTKSKQTSNYVGHIDAIDNFVIRGWVVNRQSTDAVDLVVLLNNEVVARSSANLYREDLEKAGYNQGEHGFCIALDMDVAEKGGNLSFINAEDRQPISLNGEHVLPAYTLPVTEAEKSVTHRDGTVFSGKIEHLHAGRLMGYLFNPSTLLPVRFAAYVDGALLGQGEAKLLRKELEAAGYGSGRCGFSIDINLDLLAAEKEIVLKDWYTNESLNCDTLKIQKVDQNFKAQIVTAQNNKISILIESDEAIGDKSLLVYVDTQLASQVHINTHEMRHECEVFIPAMFLDGLRHSVTLGIPGLVDLFEAGDCKLSPVLTPWEYLKESSNTQKVMTHSLHADHRYVSLSKHIYAEANGDGYVNTKDLNLVHQLVVEGHEGRKKFPKFNLPDFTKPKVSIIIPAFNKFELTYNCIASIVLSFNQTPYEVILADDCSTDETSYAEDIIGNLRVSRNDENLHFLKNCNQAAKLVKGDFIIFLNNDTEVKCGWIDGLTEPHERDNDVGITGSKLLNLDGSLQEAGGIVWGDGLPWNVGRDENPELPEYNYVRQVDFVSGASLCIRKTIWDEVDGFSEELAPAYYEDTDLAFKVKSCGYKIVYSPFSEVIHFEGASHGTDVTKGIKRNQVINEVKFRSKWKRAFKGNGVASHENLKREKDREIEGRVLVIDYATPQPNKDAGSYAAIKEIELMVALGYKVTFVPQNLAYFGVHTERLQRMGVEVLLSPFYLSMQQVLSQRLAEMDVVYITRYYVAVDYIDQIQAAGKKVIFNNADLHFLREMRAALANGKDEDALKKSLQTMQQELDIYRKADVVLTYNSTEQAVITSHIHEQDKFFITPWVLDEKPQGPGFEEREGICFLGGYNHKPNVEAVEYLCKEIMPDLEKTRPDIVLYVYGSNMPERFLDYETSNIKMVGFAESLDHVFNRHRVFVAPLLSGSGIKGKVLESMAYGMPVIMSDVAAEGIDLIHGISTLIAGKPEEFLSAILKLYDDQKIWEQFAGNEKVLVQMKYSFEHGKKRFKDIFASVGLAATH